MKLMSWITRARKTVPQDSGPTFFRRSSARVLVNEDTALSYAAFWAAVRLISETMACLSWHVHRRLRNGGSELQTDNPIDRLIHVQPNPEMCSFTFRELMQSWVLTWGNGYAEIQRDERGRPVALWPIEPWRVEAGHTENGSEIVYEVTNQSSDKVVLPARDVLHIKGMSPDGLRGYSVIAIAREAVGLGIATERFGASFFGNGSRPAGVLEYPNTLSPEALERLRESWEMVHKGAGNANKTAILENGVTFKPMAIPPNDAQFLETRKFQIDEIARIFRIPPHLLGSLDRATFSNITEQNVEWSRSIIPWAKRWEQESTRKLLGRNALFTRMNLDTLLRGDIKTRYEAYKVGREWGWLSANDILRLEDKNPIGPNGDIYLVPMNMTLPEKIGADPPAPKPPPAVPVPEQPEADEEPDDQDTEAQRMLPVFHDAIARNVRREVSRIKDAADRLDGDEFRSWSETFYPEHAIYVGNSLDASLSVLAITTEQREAIRSVVVDEVLMGRDVAVLAYQADEVESVCARWLQDRPARVARTIVQLANGVMT